jgi:hypothetical protein
MAIGKSIRIYLADASVTGIRYAESVNWTGHAIACPRARLGELQQWLEAAKPGVYFLFEGRFFDTKPIAYIGESENVKERLISHDRNKEFWSEVVIFTSKDENLTKAHIKYLESRLVDLSKTADRYQLENGNTPPESSLPRADKDAMEEFIDNIRMVLGVLGYSILEPILRSSPTGSSIQKSIDSLTQELFFKVHNISAKGLVTDEGFVIKKGSQLSKENQSSMQVSLVNLKAGLLAKGMLKDEKTFLLVVEDVLVSSSSYAGALVSGRSCSGPQSWKNANGQTLKQIEDATLNVKV